MGGFADCKKWLVDFEDSNTELVMDFQQYMDGQTPPHRRYVREIPNDNSHKYIIQEMYPHLLTSSAHESNCFGVALQYGERACVFARLPICNKYASRSNKIEGTPNEPMCNPCYVRHHAQSSPLQHVDGMRVGRPLESGKCRKLFEQGCFTPDTDKLKKMLVKLSRAHSNGDAVKTIVVGFDAWRKTMDVAVESEHEELKDSYFSDVFVGGEKMEYDELYFYLILRAGLMSVKYLYMGYLTILPPLTNSGSARLV